MISVISRSFTFELFNTISWILLIISGIVILFGRPGLGMVSVLVRSVRPQRNKTKKRKTYEIYRTHFKL